jgi:hypothetical protein
MELELAPPADDEVEEALARALDELARRDEGAAAAYASPWRRAALQEGVARGRGSAYVPAPRSSRGATRA